MTLRRRLLELDGLRALAILPVMAVHFTPFNGPLSALVPFTKAGWVGVELFFVLSGYLITGILLDTVGTPGYYTGFIARRAVRIFPLYYVALAGFTLVSWRQGLPLDGWDSPAWFALYAGNVPVALQNAWPRQGFLIVLWSLQIEEQFYLLYPALVKACSVNRLRTVLMSCVVLAPALRTAMTLLWPDHWLACYVLMPCRMDALAIGGLVALAVRERSVPAPRLLLWGLASAAGVIVAMFVWRGTWMGDAVTRSVGYTLVDVASGLLLLLVLSVPDGIVATLLRARPLVFTGQISYGLYLLHLPAAALIKMLAAPWFVIWPAGTTAMLTAFPAAFVAATLSWFTLERWGRGLRSRMDHSTPS